MPFCFTKLIFHSGDVCYQHIFGLGIVVLNSYDVASELLDGRGHIYSDRPRLTMAGELYVN